MKKVLAKFRKPKVIRTLGIVIGLLLLVGVVLFFLKTENRVSIENSIVSGPITTLSSTTPGELRTVFVTDGQKVKKGDSLAIVGSEIIRAPFDGVIVSTNQQTGSLVSSQVPVVQVIDPTKIRIDGTIDENKGLNDIKVGQVVSFTIDALPRKTFWGYVDEVADTAKQTQLSFSISSERPTQQFDVFANFAASQYPEIKNGMSAKMTVYTTL